MMNNLNLMQKNQSAVKGLGVVFSVCSSDQRVADTLQSFHATHLHILVHKREPDVCQQSQEY